MENLIILLVLVINILLMHYIMIKNKKKLEKLLDISNIKEFECGYGYDFDLTSELNESDVQKEVKKNNE